MNNSLISFIVGYFMVMNLTGIILMWLKVNTKAIKIKTGVLNVLFTVLSAVGGFIGVLVGNEMLNYAPNSKLFKRWIPLLIFLEICIGLYIAYKKMGY